MIMTNIILFDLFDAKKIILRIKVLSLLEGINLNANGQDIDLIC